MTAVIPARTRLAAKRAFVRTTYQAYAATVPAGGVTAGVVLALMEAPVQGNVAIAALVAAVVSPPIAGLAAYLDISAKGIPQDYTQD